MTGVLWSLEVLAWQPELLSRVAIILAELAEHDPGGRWANRPVNSLISIFLPWFPQTHARIDSRVAAFKAIREDFPDVAWTLAVAMLPNQHQSTSGSYKPKWKDPLPDGWQPKVNDSDYRSQILEYSYQVVELARRDSNRLVKLIDNLDNLPDEQFSEALKLISEKSRNDISEKDRRNLWEKLNQFVRKHRKYSEAKWALPEETLAEIDTVSAEIAPDDPKALYAFWFDKNDFDLLDDDGDYEGQAKRLAAKREEVIRELYHLNGLNELLEFAKLVTDPFQVGYQSAKFASAEDELALLPDYLQCEVEEPRNFIHGFVIGKLDIDDFAWADAIDKSGWKAESTLCLLLYMPFSQETWDRVSLWLADSENDYWKKVTVNPYGSEGLLERAVEKLLEVSRPNASLQCLEYMRLKKNPTNPTLVVRSLLEAISDESGDHGLQDHYIRSLISDLQKNPAVNDDDLFRIEWAYLPLLARSSDARPKVISGRLARDPEFYCEVLRLVFRSKKEEKKEEPDEDKRAIVSNAWRLLSEWKTVPGSDDQGLLDWETFKQWFNSVMEICAESGHVEVAQIKIGELLLHAPSDPDGLWINVEIARLLNHSDFADMRRGFNTEVFNSRGAFWVDPEATEERELASLWNRRAEEVEKYGFARFAASLREISASFGREIERRTSGIDAEGDVPPDDHDEDS